MVESSTLEPTDDVAVAGRVIDDFANDGADWKLYSVEGSVHPLEHHIVDGEMRLTSDSSAGLIWRAVTFDARSEPIISWRWKVSHTFSTSSPLSPEFDNFPARLVVGFDYGWKNAGPIAETWRKKVIRATGFEPPSRAICYTFGGKLDRNEAVDAAFGEGRIVVINLRATPTPTNTWHTEVRDIAADYREIFGEDPPQVMALGLGCDSHRLKKKISAGFDDITVYGSEAYAQFRSELDTPPLERRWPALVWVIFAICGLVAAGSAGAWFWMRRRDTN